MSWESMAGLYYYFGFIKLESIYSKYEQILFKEWFCLDFCNNKEDNYENNRTHTLTTSWNDPPSNFAPLHFLVKWWQLWDSRQ